MPKANDPQDRRRNIVFCLFALLLLLADQLSKTWIRASLPTGQTLFDIGFLRLTNIHNSGAAFGLFPRQSLLLTVIAFIGIPAVLLCAIFSRRYLPFLDNRLGGAALGLVLGGTVGNLIDRLRFGYVTDFIDFRIWPTFNLADASITTGIIIIAYCILRSARAERSHGGQSEDPGS